MINIEVTQSNEIAMGPELKVDDDNLKEMALTKWLEYKLRKMILINLCGLPDLTSDHPVALTECLPPPPLRVKGRSYRWKALFVFCLSFRWFHGCLEYHHGSTISYRSNRLRSHLKTMEGSLLFV